MNTGLLGRPVPAPTRHPSAPAAFTGRGLLRAAAWAAAVAAAAALAVYAAAAVAWDVPGGFDALNPFSIVVAVLVGVAAAALGLAALARLTRRPVPVFVGAAVVVTLLSLGGPLQAMAGPMNGMPEASTATGVAMILLHLLPGGVIAGLLPAWARR